LINTNLLNFSIESIYLYIYFNPFLLAQPTNQQKKNVEKKEKIAEFTSNLKHLFNFSHQNHFHNIMIKMEHIKVEKL